VSGTELQQLLSSRGYPAISIFCPTHRSMADNRQDAVRLHGLIREAVDRLSGEMSVQEIRPLLDRLGEMEGRVDYQEAEEGVGLFVGPEVASLVYFPFPIPEQVVIEETFRNRHLVALSTWSPRYRVLALSDRSTRLFEGYRDQLRELVGDQFPLVNEGPGGSEPLPSGFGIEATAQRDGRHRRFFREVSRRLGEIQKSDPLPLVLAGVEKYLALFSGVSSQERAIVGRVTGNYDRQPTAVLGKRAWAVVEAHLDAQAAQRLEELDRAVGADRYASGVDQVWRAVREGRARTLLVESGYRCPARVAEDGLSLVHADAPQQDAAGDLVDELVERTLGTGGEVVFLKDGSLAEHQRIALVLRY
jgi:hypothetical protein